MQGLFLRKYNQECTITFDLYETDGVNLKTDASHASGDTKIMKDNGAEANTTNGFIDEGQGYSITLTASEMSAAQIVLYIVDQSDPKVWLDRTVIIETYGNTSAQHAFDLDSAKLTKEDIAKAMKDQDVASVDPIEGSIWTDMIGSVVENEIQERQDVTSSVISKTISSRTQKYIALYTEDGSDSGDRHYDSELLGALVGAYEETETAKRMLLPILGFYYQDGSGNITEINGIADSLGINSSSDLSDAGWTDAEDETAGGAGYTLILPYVDGWTSPVSTKQLRLIYPNGKSEKSFDEPVDANIIQINGNATNGYNANLKLKSLDIENDSGSAFKAHSTGNNGSGMDLLGEGSGNGLLMKGGVSGGHGAYGEGQGGGHGISLTSAYRAGGEGGDGLHLKGGDSDTLEGHGLHIYTHYEQAALIESYEGIGLELSGADGENDIKAKEIGTPIQIDGGEASLTGMLTKMADDNDGADFDATSDSLHELADGSASINQQEVRDAMALSPSTSASPATGSIDEHLDDILSDIATSQSNLDDITSKLPTNNIMGSSDKSDKDDEIGAIKSKTDNLPGDPASETSVDAVESKVEDIQTNIGSPSSIDGGAATLAGMLTKMIDDNDGADFNAATDSLEKIAERVGQTIQLDDTVDGVTVNVLLQKLMAMADGRFALNVPVAGQTTFYKRDNSTPLFVVQVTTAGRTRELG